MCRWDLAQPTGTVRAPRAEVPLSCWTSAAALGNVWTSRPDIRLEPSSQKFCAQVWGDYWWTVGAAIQLAECGDRFWRSCHIHRLKQCVSVSGPLLVTYGSCVWWYRWHFCQQQLCQYDNLLSPLLCVTVAWLLYSQCIFSVRVHWATLYKK